MNDKLEIGLKFWQLVGSRLGFLREGKTRVHIDDKSTPMI